MGAALADFICTDAARVVLALTLIAGTLLLLLQQRTVPDVLWALDGAAVGFYFGGATVNSRNRVN